MLSKEVRLGEYVTVDSGYAFKSSLFNDENKGMPIIRIRDVTTGSTHTFYNGEFDEKYIVENGDLLISMDGEFKIHEWKGGKALLNQRVCRIKSSNKILSDKYILYVLPIILKKIEDKTPFVTVKHLSVKDIMESKVLLPPIEIQNKIIKVLDISKDLINKRKSQIEELDQLTQSVFLEMFGDPILNNKQWPKEKLGELCTVVRGGSPRPIEKFLGGTVPWIKIGDASKGDSIYLKGTKEKIIEEGIKKSRLIKEGSLIFANCGVSLGFARIITFDGCIHDGWLAFQDISKKINKIFLLKLLNQFTEYFRRTAPDGTQPNLNTTIMKNFEVIIPPLDIQEKYVEIITNIESKKELFKKSYNEIEAIYKSLIQRAFKGELFTEEKVSNQ